MKGGNGELKREDRVAVESFLAAEDRMNKKWGWFAWQKMTTPDMASKYAKARERYFEALDSREAGVLIKCCENLVRGLDMIDRQLHEVRAPDDVFYLQARINKKNYYFVSDELDMQRIIPLMKGKDPVVYTLQEMVTVIEAANTKQADSIKQAFPGAQIQSIAFKHKMEMIDDEIPF